MYTTRVKLKEKIVNALKRLTPLDFDVPAEESSPVMETSPIQSRHLLRTGTA
jgi:hypothetical protein